MNINCKNINDAIVIKVSGEINVVNAGEFEQDTLFAIKENSYPLVIDFTELTYISSSGLGSLIAVAKEAKRQKRKMNIVVSNGLVKNVLYRTGLTPLFEISTKSH